MLLIMFVKSGEKARYWFTFSGEGVSPETSDGLQKTLATISPPKIDEGPVVAALAVDLWGGPDTEGEAPTPLSDNMLFPKEWEDAAKAKGVRLRIPLAADVLSLMWPD